jgi:hypothetical protein
MSTNYESIKSASQEKARSIASRDAQSQPQPDDLLSSLRSSFSEAIASRDEASEAVSALLSRRVDIAEALISVLTASSGSLIVSSNLVIARNVFDVMGSCSSSDFVEKASSMIYAKAENFSQADVSALQSYFSEKFDEVASKLLPGSTVSFSVSGTRDTRLTVNGSPVTGETQDSNAAYWLLYLLGVFKNAQSMQDDIRGYIKNFNRNDQETEGIPAILSRSIGAALRRAEGALRTIKGMESYRKSNDPKYSGAEKYLEDLSSAVSSLLELTPSLSDLTPENVELVRQSGSYARAVELSQDIEDQCREIASDAAYSMSRMDEVLEDYSMFIGIPSSETDAMERAVEVAESFFNLTEDPEGIVIENAYDPFGGRNITEWSAELIADRKVNANIFDLIVIFVGNRIRSLLGDDAGSALVNYSLSRLLRRGLILREVVSQQFSAALDSEYALFKNHRVRMSDRPQDERLPLFVESEFPGLGILDYLTFEEALEFNAASPDPDETSLRNRVRLLIIESIGRRRLEGLDSVIPRLIDLARQPRERNLKSLYFELCFIAAMEKFSEYLSTGTNLAGSSVSEDTLEYIDEYLDEGREAQIGQLLRDYIDSYAYLRSPTSDLIDLAISDPATKALLRA